VILELADDGGSAADLDRAVVAGSKLLAVLRL
jgi:hypothetical protein